MPKGSKSRERIEWDGVVTGLGLRCQGGARSWIVQRRVEGRTVRRKIGDGAAMDRRAARVAARVMLGALADEAQERMPTFAEFAERFLTECAPRWKPPTIASHRIDTQSYIVPAFGSQRLDALTQATVLEQRDGLPMTAGSKNRIMAVLSAMIGHAELLEFREPGANPCKGLRKRVNSFKASYLTTRTTPVWGRL